MKGDGMSKEEYQEIKTQLNLIISKLDTVTTTMAVHEEKFKNIDLKCQMNEKEACELKQDLSNTQKTAWGAMVGLVLSLLAFVFSIIKDFRS